jgi:hypothetical protein
LAGAADLSQKFERFEVMAKENGIPLPWTAAPSTWRPVGLTPTPASMIPRYQRDIEEFAAGRQPTRTAAGNPDPLRQYNMITDPRQKTEWYRKNKAAYDAAWAAANK